MALPHQRNSNIQASTTAEPSSTVYLNARSASVCPQPVPETPSVCPVRGSVRHHPGQLGLASRR